MSESKLFVPSSPDQLLAELQKLTGTSHGRLEEIRSYQRDDVVRATILGGANYRSEPRKPLEEYNPDVATLRDVKVYGNSSATATTDMFQSEWSPSFIHGPDIMLPAANLMAMLLAEDETIATIESLRFLQLMRANVLIYTSIGDTVKGTEKLDPSTCVMKASFKSSNDRQVSLMGFLTNSPITGPRVVNNFAYDITRDFAYLDYESENDEDCVLPLAPTGLPNSVTDGFIVTNSLEIAIIAAQQLRALGILPDDKNALAAGFESFNLPDPKKLAQGGTLGLKVCWDREKQTSRYIITPIEVHFYSLDGERLGGGIYNRAQEK